MRIEATESSGLPLEIFVHQRVSVDPHDENLKEEFVSVASVFDLTVYPADEPDPTQSPPYFRKSAIDVVLPTQTIADESWDLIKTEVCTLITALNAMDVLVVAEEFVCGEMDSEEPDSEDSE